MPTSGLQIRVGGGLTYHIVGGIGGSGGLEGTEMGVDPALGGTAEISVANDILKGDLRYTRMSTDVEYLGASTNMDASSIGLFLGLMLTPFI